MSELCASALHVLCACRAYRFWRNDHSYSIACRLRTGVLYWCSVQFWANLACFPSFSIPRSLRDRRFEGSNMLRGVGRGARIAGVVASTLTTSRSCSLRSALVGGRLPSTSPQTAATTDQASSQQVIKEP
nr:hypothetical protein CFP56_10091 [Quercus suber]